MSRRDQWVIQFILWVAIATFLFGIWAIVMGLRNPSPPPSSSAGDTANGHSAAGPSN